jgi:hypothetical protein
MDIMKYGIIIRVSGVRVPLPLPIQTLGCLMHSGVFRFPNQSFVVPYQLLGRVIKGIAHRA